MPEADFEPDIPGLFNYYGGDAAGIFLEVKLAEQRDRRRLLDIFDHGIVDRIIGLRLILDSTKHTRPETPEIIQLKEALDCAIENSHALIDEMAPHVLLNLGLKAALRDLFWRHAQNRGLRYYINIPDHVPALLGDSASLVIYSLIEKIVSGSVFSCYADTVGITLEASDNAVKLLVQDDGYYSGDFEQELQITLYPARSFLSEAAGQVLLLGGSFWVDSAAGTRRIRAEFPLNSKSSK